MKKENAITKVVDAYATNPRIRTLAGAAIAGVALINPAIGVGSATIDQVIVNRTINLIANRTRIFFDEANKGEHLITQELLEDDDLVHATIATLSAAIHTRHEEKIRLLARLLINSTRDKFYKTDEFEEFVAILDDLSMREFTILLTLKEYQDAAFADNVNNDKNNLQTTSTYWEPFSNKISRLLGIPLEEITALLTRLNRTGLYESFDGSAWDYEGGQGMLTPIFYKFIEKLMDEYTPEKPKA